MSNVLFPFWLWLLIVLIIILIVLWLLFRPEAQDQERDSSRSASFETPSEGAVVEAEADIVAVSTPDLTDPVPEPQPRTAEILDVVDEVVEEDEPIEADSDVVVEIIEETPDDDIEDTVVSEETVAEDNLRIVEGIGPKIESVLKNAGVRTLRQLSEMSVESIQVILTENNLRLANPETWPEQARLAANGEMTALEALQDKLKGGRIV